FPVQRPSLLECRRSSCSTTCRHARGTGLPWPYLGLLRDPTGVLFWWAFALGDSFPAYLGRLLACTLGCSEPVALGADRTQIRICVVVPALVRIVDVVDFASLAFTTS